MQAGLTPVAPTGGGSFTDLEDMNLESKLQYLRSNKLLKCMNKIEVLAEHATTWRENGLSNLQYTEVSREALGEHATKITVDVMLNCGHWTDKRSGIQDPQL